MDKIIIGIIVLAGIVVLALVLAGVTLGKWYPELSDCLLVAVTERRTKADIDCLAKIAGSLNG